MSGLFSVQLGDGTPFAALFLANLDYWIEVFVDLDRSGTFAVKEIYLPRQHLTSATYAVNSDCPGGLAPTDVAPEGHNHDTRYIELSGDTTTGALTIPELRYVSPRTHYYSAPGDAFRPRTHVNFLAAEGEGGGYITGTGENGSNGVYMEFSDENAVVGKTLVNNSRYAVEILGATSDNNISQMQYLDPQYPRCLNRRGSKYAPGGHELACVLMRGGALGKSATALEHW